MTRIQNCDDAQSVSGRICAALLKPYVVNGQELHLDIALGTGIYPSDGESVDELMKKLQRIKSR
jgi:GGDEF domain-containing protein